MSLLRSISTAVTGLTAQSYALGNISDNLANATTKGFKSIGTSFGDIVSQDGAGGQNGSSSTSGSSIGMGTMSRPVYYNNIQGSIAQSTMPTYMAISGNGFFAVTPDATGGSSQNEVCYTRCGDFTADNTGCLVNSSGYALLSWSVDSATGTVNSGTLVPTQITDLTDEGVATTKLSFDANLPASLDVNATTSDSIATVYDSKGYGHDITYSWEKTGTNTWDLTVTAKDGAYNAATDSTSDYVATASFVFDVSGPHPEVNAAGETVTVDNTGHVLSVTSADCPVTDNTLSLSVSYKDQDPLVTTPTALLGDMTADFASLTQFADTKISVSSFSQNGIGNGSFKSFTIDDKGFASFNYTNGVTRTVYQIPIATFNSPESLEKISGTAFKETVRSGTAAVNASDTNGAGSFIVGGLENSTVDIADQFTRMIQAQLAYSANSKTITTADTMLKTIIQV